MKNPKVNYEEYELANGECVAMSTAPILMLTLRKKDKKAYETLSKVAEFLYAAYKNANQDEEEAMAFTEFFENMNQSWQKNLEVIAEMYSPSKKQDSGTDSEE